MTPVVRIRSTVIDCPDPQRLAEFYRDLVDGELLKPDPDDDWYVVSVHGRHRIAFQGVEDYRPPRWPDPEYPQQFHLDFTVEDPEAAEAHALALGATKAAVQPGEDEDFLVYLDPAGHPFCLCTGEPEGLRPLAD